MVSLVCCSVTLVKNKKILKSLEFSKDARISVKFHHDRWKLGPAASDFFTNFMEKIIIFFSFEYYFFHKIQKKKIVQQKSLCGSSKPSSQGEIFTTYLIRPMTPFGKRPLGILTIFIIRTSLMPCTLAIVIASLWTKRIIAHAPSLTNTLAHTHVHPFIDVFCRCLVPNSIRLLLPDRIFLLSSFALKDFLCTQHVWRNLTDSMCIRRFKILETSEKRSREQNDFV